MSPRTIFNRGSGESHQKEAWVHRFAIAAFMADHSLEWETATEAAETLWTDFGTLAPEELARTRSDFGSLGEP
jgi:hypothetical protein